MEPATYTVSCLIVGLLCIEAIVAQEHQLEDVPSPQKTLVRLGENGGQDIARYLERWASRKHFVDVVRRYTQSDRSGEQANRILSQTDTDWTDRDPESHLDRSVNAQSGSSCTGDLLKMINALQKNETWALRMFDSWGKPGTGFLEARITFGGNYDECRAVTAPETSHGEGFRGNYCELRLGIEGAPPEVILRWGLCMPDSCSEDDTSGIVTQLLQATNLTMVYVSSVEIRDDERDFSTASLLAVIAASVFGIMALAGTTYDLVFVQLPRWREESEDEGYGAITESSSSQQSTTSRWPEGTNPDGSVDDRSYEKSDSFGTLHETAHFQDVLHNTFLAFSVYQNASSVLSTQERSGTITCLHGIRFFSMTWVVLIHMYSELEKFSMNIIPAFLDMTQQNIYSVAFNGTVCVDTFFTMSGFVLGYLKIKEYKEKGFVIKWRYFYFHRLWRLAPPYMLYLLFILGLTRFFGSGAQWSEKQPLDQENCENYWWTNLLFINNFVHWDKLCIMQSWFLSDDFQFHIVSPLLFTPFFLSRYAGFLVCGGALVACWTYTFVMAMINDWRLVDFREVSRDRLHNYYYSPFCRIAPFIIGIMAGFVLANNNGRIKLPKRWMAPLAWVAAFTIGILVVFGVHGDVSGDDYSSKGVAAIYLAFARSGWSAAICWMILACASGYGGPINAFLSWKPFLIMSRLSYTAYLVHIYVMHTYLGNLDYPFYITAFSIIFTYMTVAIMSLLLGFVLVVTVEIPLVSLEQVFLGQH